MRRAAARSMLRVCRACTPNEYTLKLVCPRCKGPTVLPYGTASTHRRGSGKTLKQLVKAYPPPESMGSSDEVVRDLEPVDHGAPSRYGLIHTLGRTKFDPFGGDGAYSLWMQDYFSGSGLSSSGCVGVRSLQHDGPFGNIKNSELATKFNPVFLAKFKSMVFDCYATASTIIVNWHIRFTNGTPNGWTGRGINPDLVRAMRKLCANAGKKLAIVYTIHEASVLSDKLCSPRALVALNPAVRDSMASQFTLTPFLSKVPGLLNSTHTVKIDTVMKLVGEYLGPIDIESPSSNLYFALGQQALRLKQGAMLGSLKLKGIVIFGMIMPRHGLTVENVQLLSDCMDHAGLSSKLKIVIAGKESDATLVKDLKKLHARGHRVVFKGQIADFAELAGCRYAISFDELGYRDNASAMVNTIRAGHLLFSRRGHESDKSLVRGAVGAMAVCERSDYFYYELLARQQPRMRNTSPEVVGSSLDLFFRNVAKALREPQ